MRAEEDEDVARVGIVERQGDGPGLVREREVEGEDLVRDLLMIGVVEGRGRGRGRERLGEEEDFRRILTT